MGNPAGTDSSGADSLLILVAHQAIGVLLQARDEVRKMPVEVIGIDHVYLTVRDLARSEAFYDRVMPVLGYRKTRSTIADDAHVHSYNRHFGFSLRPARDGTANHDPYAPGLHHFCFRVIDERAVDRAAEELVAAGIDATRARYYPEYAPDYYATFFTDPDGMRLEVTNFRANRRQRMFDWDASRDH
jgi:glyoxylase I family protein